ncbi:uncharacterized protein EV422DRAFT_571763 [Fimicolochytrium jonesii]|uniref:uncharacterized protein n=1 Tax=Fimicolochytrium jonesii TaxID=1396493 RepID=UPI0022FECB5C|nr:uncharacterized protein EV422DRAFT_571763 [Fimicolochytrium jonesii]KAI8816378.1 hypothetical protein EV422DRAFT_571763 [Fimicolochytrium jonesii]
MFTFEGDFKSRRNINLGGRKKDLEDKKELLRRAQAERKERERERAKERAAIDVQAFWRGRKHMKRFYASIREQWDTEIKSAAASTSNAIPPAKVSSLVRRFLFFYSPLMMDRVRLVELLCPLLLRGGSGTSLRNVIAPFPSMDAKEWQYILVKLCRVCLANLFFNDGVSTTDSKQPSNIILLLEAILNRDASAAVATYTPGWDYVQELFFVIGDDMFAKIRAYISSHTIDQRDLPSTSHLMALTTLPLTLLESLPTPSPRRDHIIALVITHILTIEYLPNRISIDALQAFSQKLRFSAIVDTLNNGGEVYERVERERATGEGDMFAALLGNVLAFGQQAVGKMGDEALSTYISVLSNLLERLPSNYLNALNPSTTNNAAAHIPDDDDDMDIDPAPSSSSKSPSTATIHPQLRKWLLLLTKPALLDAIVKALPDSTSSLPSNPGSVAISETVATFLLSLVTAWTAAKTEIATILLYRLESGNAFLRRLWTCVVNGPLWAALKRNGRNAVGVLADEKYAGQWAILILFCEFFVRVFTTLGDDELVGAKPPVAVDVLIELSGVLKNVVFDMYWNDSAPGFQRGGSARFLQPEFAVELFTRVLRQIHARDSRRSFCPKDHWLLASLPVDESTFLDLALQHDHKSEPHDASDNHHLTSPTSRQPAISPLFPTPSATLKQSKVIQCRNVLTHIPFVIPFAIRVNIFRTWIADDRKSQRLDENWMRPAARATIRRGSVFEDGYTHLNALGSQLKRRVAITFVSEQGLVEAGIDGGGVFKEFLTSLSAQAFDINYGLFQATPDNLLYPSPHSYAAQETQLHHLEFLGRIMGKALYEGVLVNAAFANFFLAKWLGQRSYVDDLPSLDPEMYAGLMFLKHYTGDVERDLGLTFSLDKDEFGNMRTVNLIPDGSNVAVTRENRIQYIYLVANYKLNVQIQRQCAAFFSGLTDLIHPGWLRVFNQQELQSLLGGTTHPISIPDLQAHTTYAGGYTAQHRTIELFWSVVSNEFSEEEKRGLVKFVTSCERPPLMGFGELRPGFCVRCAGEDVGRLPTASTCVNLLKLPPYTDIETMRT